mgnify:CR=1 FL=1
MAELLMTAGTDDEIFTFLGLIVTPIMAYLVYVGFFCDGCDGCDGCKKKWRKEDGQKSNS